MFTRAERPRTETEVPAPNTSMMSSPLVPFTITMSAAPSPAVPPMVPARLTFTSTTSVPERSLTMIVSVLPSALRSILSTIVQIHDDVAEVAGEQHAPAVGGRREDLGGAGAIEQHGVGAVLTLDGVRAVTRIPLKHVIAGTEEGHVVALLAVNEVVAVAAKEKVGAVAAENGVVASAAVDRDLNQRGEVAGGREAVVRRRSC